MTLANNGPHESATGAETPNIRFSDLDLLPEILAAVKEQGYETPSPIQAQAIPAVLSGKDVMAAAQTGTGKTAGFTLPMLHLLSRGQRAKANQVRALVLTPTRELAAQVQDNVYRYSKHLPLRSEVVFGGVKINPQMMRLRRGADILVATPGRLLDLYQQNAIGFKQLEILVLDEADRMLDMGFIHDIRKILALLPKQRQNLMFSATFSDDIRALAKTIVHSPIEVSVTPKNSTADTVEQWLVPVDKSKKSAVLTRLIKDNDWQQVLVFSRTKHGANRLAKQLTDRKLNAAAIHGNKSQGARTKALEQFKNGQVRVLVATDIAARGIDIDQLPHVVNYDLPNVSEDYVHRIGRTGRAGASGLAVSLVCADEFKLLADIERLIGQLIERRLVDGYEPEQALPESRLNTRPIKAKKPKKAKVSKEHHDGQRSGDNASGHRHRRGGQGANAGGNRDGQNPQGRRRRPQQGRGQSADKGNGQRRHSGNGQRRSANPA